MLKKLKTYVMNVIGEMKKVSWPTRSELVNSTIVVIVISAIAALLVGILDFIFATSLSMVLRSR
jgi:preprotein translocase subunit SecE